MSQKTTVSNFKLECYCSGLTAVLISLALQAEQVFQSLWSARSVRLSRSYNVV